MAPRFLHQHRQFPSLLEIVAEQVGVSAALVEKDYWVTHVLWALQSLGFRVSFKGGTSLSKAYGLIQRFSEDLDLMLEAPDLPAVSSWKSDKVRATTSRRQFYEAVQNRLAGIPDVGVGLHENSELWDKASFAVRYRTSSLAQLPAAVRPFVLLELGVARVTPGEDRALTSWVHDHVEASTPELGANLVQNRPSRIHCVRPEVTLLEKVDALGKRSAREDLEPGAFVRHYEDIVRILDFAGLSPIEELRRLLEQLLLRDIKKWPEEGHPGLDPEADPERWKRLELAWEANAPLFWGPRIPLRTCAERIRAFLRSMADDSGSE